MSASGFSSSASMTNWSTATTRDWKDTGDLTNVPENALLGRVAAKWSTPTAHDGRRPGADVHSTQGNNLSRDVALWATPRSSDGEKGGPNQKFGAGGTPLPAQASQWTTPSAGDGQRGGKITENMSGTSLTQQVNSLDMEVYTSANIWPTPTAMNRPRNDETLEKCRATRKAKAGQNTVPLYLEDVASRLSLPAPATSTDGEKSSHIRRTLNPLFVEWLMGWPPGWTSLALTPLASNACACSATALSAWKARMRSALSQLALPAEAPPAQLALFG